MKDLRGIFQIIEEQAMIPSQWKTSLIVMLPKKQQHRATYRSCGHHVQAMVSPTK